MPLDEVASPGAAELLDWAVRARANVVVSGGAGAGKTTLLNALAAVDPARRAGGDHRGRGRAAAAGRPRGAARGPTGVEPEGAGEVRIRDLVRAALRMRPDRIVVGEVRAGEALDMLQAMNTGHEGSLSTCHANGPVEALSPARDDGADGRCRPAPRRVREQVVSAVDLVVHIARAADGRRRVVAVAEVGRGDDDGRACATRRWPTSRGWSTCPQRAHPVRRRPGRPAPPGWAGEHDPGASPRRRARRGIGADAFTAPPTRRVAAGDAGPACWSRGRSGAGVRPVPRGGRVDPSRPRRVRPRRAARGGRSFAARRHVATIALREAAAAGSPCTAVDDLERALWSIETGARAWSEAVDAWVGRRSVPGPGAGRGRAGARGRGGWGPGPVASTAPPRVCATGPS